MGTLETIFKNCISFLKIEMHLGNYDFSLYGFLIYSIVAVLLLRIIIKLFRDNV